MLLKKYRSVDGAKFIRIKLDWSAGNSFCRDAAKCNLVKGTRCGNKWIQERCSVLGMDSKANKFSYIPC